VPKDFISKFAYEYGSLGIPLKNSKATNNNRIETMVACNIVSSPGIPSHSDGESLYFSDSFNSQLSCGQCPCSYTFKGIMMVLLLIMKSALPVNILMDYKS
tara:strand:- start:62 stop:364 length:303 start_codon:yes stop_codon:yes gene_type:complete